MADELKSRVRVVVVWVDEPFQLVELQISVSHDGWSGWTRVYVHRQTFIEDVAKLLDWSKTCLDKIEIRFTEGFKLNCVPNGSRGHLALNIGLGIPAYKRSDKFASRFLRMNFPTVPGPLARFCREMIAVAEGKIAVAELTVE